MNRPSLSVAMATYNGERFLREQLDSIASQSRLPDELVVRDDGSTDGTLGVLEEFAHSAPFPVRILPSGPNLGYAKNFGAVLAACGGDLVALSDQDDVWRPEKLARLEAALGSDPEALLAFSDLELVDEGLRPLGRRMWQYLGMDDDVRARFGAGWQDSPLLSAYYVTGAAACLRAPLLDAALPIVLDGYHDAWLALIAALRGRVVPVNEPLVLYRQHGRNQIGAPEKERFWEGVERRLFRWDIGERVVREAASARRDLLIGVRRRLAERGALPAEQREVLHAHADHFAFRAEIPPYPERAWGIARELVGGRYQTLSLGWRAALRDGIRSPLFREGR